MSIRIIEDYFGEKKSLSTHRGIFPCSLKHIICTHISSFLNLPPLQVITEHRAEFPVLYNNFLLAICVLHTVVCICQYICHVYMSVCIHQCMCRVYTSVYMLCVYVTVYVVCICQWYSGHATLPFPHDVHRFFFYVRVSLPALQIGSSVPCFLDSAYMH